jgi:ribosome maturation protein Sdo1
MTEVNCKVNGNKPAKPQALAFITDLKKVIPIERSRMQLRITFRDAEQSEKLLSSLTGKFDGQFTVNSNKQKPDSAICLLDMSVDPALFREISQLTKQDKESFADVTLEIMDS